ncbi:MAG: hypothetical protein GY859_22340, partial [Desulfobacterales bacterium]|nr:hypothetical protein [Desulfobacterales bacterium]
MDFSVSLGVWTGVDETPPVVQLTYSPAEVNVGDPVTITFYATMNVIDTVTFTLYAADNAGVVNKTLTVNGAPLTLVNNTAVYQATEMGVHTAEAFAADAAGFTSSDSASFMVYDPNDATPPIAFLGDSDCVDVTDLYSITGAVTDAGPVFYGLYYREQGSDG